MSENVHDDYKLRGYKATLSNDSTSEEAKEHARQELERAGISTDSYIQPGDKDYAPQPDDVDDGVGNTGGRGTQVRHDGGSSHKGLVDDEARGNSGRVTRSKGGASGGNDKSEGLSGNEIRGYKSTLSNKNTSEEAKDHAKQVLEEAGAI